MRGSIKNRPNGWTIIYDAGLKWSEKKGQWVRNQKWEKVPPPNTKKHAEKLLAERLSQINKGEFVEPTKITFTAFTALWMKKYAEGEVRHSTLVQYRGIFKLHLEPTFGGLELSKIGVEEVQSLKAEKIASGLSPQSVKHILRLLRQMLNHAMDWGYLRTNPAKKVRYPKIPKREMDFLNPREISLFLEALPVKWYPFFLTAIVTGLRIGELLAMRWQHLDWNSNQYFVKETWLRPRGGQKASFSDPKTDSSIAPVDLTPTCLNALREHRRIQAQEKLEAGEKYLDNDLIFATPLGRPLHDGNVVSRIFRPSLQEAGLRVIRFHDLRHTCATLLINQNESPKYVQKQLRHASIRVTFDRYGHLFPDVSHAATSRLDSTLFGNLNQAIPG